MIRPHLVLTARLVAAAGIAVFAAGSAHAQKIRPGLWENTVSMKSGGGQMDAAMARMRDELARMPPEQRAQVEAMMARQGLGMAAGQPNTLRSCVSPEMAARDMMDTGDGRCKSTGHSRTGNVVRFKFACQGEGNQPGGEGEGEFTLISDTENKGKVSITTSRQGQPLRMDIESASRWVAADCGAIKPVR